MGTSAAGESSPAGPTLQAGRSHLRMEALLFLPRHGDAVARPPLSLSPHTHTPHLNGFLPALCPRGHCALCKSRVTWARHFVPCQRGTEASKFQGLIPCGQAQGLGGQGAGGGDEGKGAPARHPTLPASVARGRGWGWLCEGERVPESVCRWGLCPRPLPGPAGSWRSCDRVPCRQLWSAVYSCVYGAASQVVL